MSKEVLTSSERYVRKTNRIILIVGITSFVVFLFGLLLLVSSGGETVEQQEVVFTDDDDNQREDQRLQLCVLDGQVLADPVDFEKQLLRSVAARAVIDAQRQTKGRAVFQAGVKGDADAGAILAAYAVGDGRIGCAVGNQQNLLPGNFNFAAFHEIGALGAQHQVKQMLLAAVGAIHHAAVGKNEIMHFDIMQIKIAEGQNRNMLVKNRNHLLYSGFLIYIIIFYACQ